MKKFTFNLVYINNNSNTKYNIHKICVSGCEPKSHKQQAATSDKRSDKR